MILIRRTISFLRVSWTRALSTFKIIFIVLANHGTKIPFSCRLGSGVKISSTDGGTITLGSNVSVGRDSLLVSKGGHLHIGNDVQLGPGCILVTLEDIQIGSHCLIAEYVVIRDQDHDFEDNKITAGKFSTQAIRVGAQCWIGTKATLLKGADVGNNVVIGAHSLVTDVIKDNAVAYGCPAKVRRYFGN